eukprot:gene11614-13021_t
MLFHSVVVASQSTNFGDSDIGQPTVSTATGRLVPSKEPVDFREHVVTQLSLVIFDPANQTIYCHGRSPHSYTHCCYRCSGKEGVLDLFDFHGYCMRKATLLRAYMDMLTTRDNSYGHVSFQRAFRGAVSILLHVVKEEFANLHGTDRLLDFVNSYLVTAIGRDSLPQQQQQQVLAGLKALQVADKAAVVQARCADISTREDN